MKRSLLVVAPLFLAACGGGDLNLNVTSDDLSDNNALSVTAAGEDLTTVQSVKVTVDEIWAHVAGGDAKDDVKGEDVADEGKGWQLVSDEDREIDLMTVRNNATKPLGDVALPEGKITQLRLKLKATEEVGDRLRISSAVTEANGTVCDLTVPKNAATPGVKISGVFKAMKIENGGKYHAIINLKLKDSAKELTTGASGCSYRLNPVMKVKKFAVASDAEK